MQSTVIQNNQHSTPVYPATPGMKVISTTTTCGGPAQMQQGGHPHPQQQVVVVQAPMYRHVRRTPVIYEKYPALASQILGGTQLALGILIIAFSIVGIVIQTNNAGQAIGAGIFFIITGCFGIPAGRMRTQCFIVTFMVLSIISSVIAFSITITHALGTSCDSRDDCWDGEEERDEDLKDVRVAIGITSSIMALTELIVAIVSSSLCCAGMCCRGGATRGQVIGNQGQPVQHMTTPHPGYSTAQDYSQPMGVGYPVQGSAYPTQGAGYPTQGSAPPAYTENPPAYSNPAAPTDQQLYKY